MTPPLSIAVLGAGFMGGMHARTLASLPQARVVAIADPKPGVAQTLAAELGCAALTDPGAALADPAIAAVVIATPDVLHVDITVAALKAGKAVLLEKPMAHDSAGARAIADAGGRLMVAQICRFDPRYRRARALVEAGGIGETVHVSTTRFCGHPGQRAVGSHLCWLMGVHDVDLIQWITGRSITRIVAARAIADAIPTMKVGVDDVVFALAELDGGGLAQLSFGWTLPANFPLGIQVGFRLIGTTGAVDIADSDTSVLSATPAGVAYQDSFFWPAFGRDIEGALRAEDVHFVDAVLTDRPFSVAVEDTFRAVAVNDAIRAALASGGSVTV